MAEFLDDKLFLKIVPIAALENFPCLKFKVTVLLI